MAKRSSKKPDNKKNKNIEKDPAFQRTRENMSEFGRAARANKLLRWAFHESIVRAKDRFVSARLTKRMSRIILSDDVHTRGNRRVILPYLRLLEGFNFNHDRPLTHVLLAPYEVTADRAAGRVRIDFPFFNAATMTDGSCHYYHFNLVGMVVSVDFEQDVVHLQRREFQTWASNDDTTRPFRLDLHLPPGFAKPLIVALGVEMLTYDGPDREEVDLKQLSALSVVKVFT